MRLVSAAVLLLLGVALTPVRAASLDDKSFSQQVIDDLRDKASRAQPREQCFLYSQLLHRMTEQSVRQYAEGNVERASALLKQVGDLTRQVHSTVADNGKRLKDAEILLRQAAFRLNNLMRSISYEERGEVAAALAQVNQVQNEAMMTVLRQ
jgi:hypothetical protein